MKLKLIRIFRHMHHNPETALQVSESFFLLFASNDISFECIFVLVAAHLHESASDVPFPSIFAHSDGHID